MRFDVGDSMLGFGVALNGGCSSLEFRHGGRAETGKRRAGKKCKFGVLWDAGAEKLEAVWVWEHLAAGHRAEVTGVWAWEARGGKKPDAGGQTEWGMDDQGQSSDPTAACDLLWPFCLVDACFPLVNVHGFGRRKQAVPATQNICQWLAASNSKSRPSAT